MEDQNDISISAEMPSSIVVENVHLKEVRAPGDLAPVSAIPTVTDTSSYSYLETHKITQRSTARKIAYTIKNAVKMISAPAGLARSYTLQIPDPRIQRDLDLQDMDVATKVKNLVKVLPRQRDPTEDLARAVELIKHCQVSGDSVRLAPVTDFTVMEAGRTVAPAWTPDSPFELKDTPENMTHVKDFISRWGTGQMAATIDNLTITSAVGRALQDFIIANMLKRIVGDRMEVWCLDPSSVNARSYSPKWMQVTTPYSESTARQMSAIQRILITQLERELATVPPSEAPTDPRARILYALKSIDLYFDAFGAVFKDELNVYCGGLVPTRELYVQPASGSQLALVELAAALAVKADLAHVTVEVTRATGADGFDLIPEPYYADLYGEHLAFISQMHNFVGTVQSKSPIAAYMQTQGIGQKYTLLMEPAYWKQSYIRGTLTVGGQVLPMLIPDYGLTRLIGSSIGAPVTDAISTLSEAAVNILKNIVGANSDELVTFELADAVGDSGSLDPSSFGDYSLWTTESPLSICTIEEHVISPYVFNALDDVLIDKLTAAFEEARLAYFTMITPTSYVGAGYLPYRQRGSSSGYALVLADTAMFKFDYALGEYLSAITDNVKLSAIDTFVNNIAGSTVFLPLGGEDVRQGGVVMQGINVSHCIKLDGTNEELTVTGPMIFDWSADIRDLLSWHSAAPIQKALSPFFSRR